MVGRGVHLGGEPGTAKLNFMFSWKPKILLLNIVNRILEFSTTDSRQYNF